MYSSSLPESYIFYPAFFFILSLALTVLKMRSLLNEIEEPLEEFNDKLFHELVKGIEINKQDEMTVTFLGGLKFTELI